MDDELRTAFVAAVDAVFARVDERDVVPTLVEDGWEEFQAADPAFAVGTLFEAAGRALSAAPLFDLLDPRGSFARPVFVTSGREVVAHSTCQGTSVIDGITRGALVPSSVLVPFVGDEGQPATLEVDAQELEWRRVEGIDPSAAMWRVAGRVDSTSARVVSIDPPLQHLLRRCLAHELIGLADEVLGLVRQHVIIRSQFGRPIASWQTVQHRLADAYVELTAGRSLLDFAWTDQRKVVTAAGCDQAVSAASTAIDHAQQLFGAIGFTWEHPLHGYVRRFQVLRYLMGSASSLQHEIGTSLMQHKSVEAVHVDI